MLNQTEFSSPRSEYNDVNIDFKRFFPRYRVWLSDDGIYWEHVAAWVFRREAVRSADRLKSELPYCFLIVTDSWNIHQTVAVYYTSSEQFDERWRGKKQYPLGGPKKPYDIYCIRSEWRPR